MAGRAGRAVLQIGAVPFAADEVTRSELLRYGCWWLNLATALNCFTLNALRVALRPETGPGQLSEERGAVMSGGCLTHD